MWPVGQGTYTLRMGRYWYDVSSNSSVFGILRDWFFPAFAWGGTPHKPGELNVRDIPFDDLGGILIAISCLILIGLGKETTTVTSVLLTVVGFIFGKYTRKSKR